MRIAIVDDLKEDRNELKEVLLPFFHTFDFEIELYEFSCAEDFLEVFETEQFDICFMDIYMGEINGMEAAKVIAREDPNCFLIFLTASTDYIAEGYDVRAWRYIVKPLKKEAAARMLTPCIEKIVLSKRYLTVKADRQDRKLPFSKIFYAITVNREIEIHLNQTCLRLSARTSFSKVTEPLLEDYRFISCGKGIVVNLSQVLSVNESGLHMRNGQDVPVSKRKINQIHAAFMQYSFENM